MKHISLFDTFNEYLFLVDTNIFDLTSILEEDRKNYGTLLEDTLYINTDNNIAIIQCVHMAHIVRYIPFLATKQCFTFSRDIENPNIISILMVNNISIEEANKLIQKHVIIK